MVGPVMRLLKAIWAWWKVARWAIGALATTARKTGYANSAPKAITTAVMWTHRTTS